MKTAETTLYEGPASQWTNVPAFIGWGLLFIVGAYGTTITGLSAIRDGNLQMLLAFSGRWIMLGAALGALRSWWIVRFMVYRITNLRIEVERGLISKRIENIDLFRVQDVQLQISIIDRAIGIGSVLVKSTDKTTPTIKIRGVPEPRRIYDDLKRESLAADRRAGVVHVET